MPALWQSETAATAIELACRLCNHPERKPHKSELWPNLASHNRLLGDKLLAVDPKYRALLALLIIPTAWVAVAVLISHVGGWVALARAYSCLDFLPSDQWSFQSAAMRYWINYGNCLTVGVSPQGLYLAIFFLLRVGHPPLLIPWSDISICRKRVLWSKVVELRLGREPSIPFRITESLGERLRASAGKSWPAESVT